MRAWLQVAPLVLLAAGCRSGQRMDDPETALARAIYLVESSESGQRIGLSDAEAAEESVQRAVSRVPNPGVADVNSRIDIYVLSGELKPEDGGLASGGAESLQVLSSDARTLEVESKLADLERVLNDLARFLELRAERIRAYDSFQATRADGPGDRELLTAYREARSESNEAESAVIDGLVGLYPSGDERMEVEALGSDFSQLVPLLQAKLDAAAAEREAMVERAAFKLRLEAFLQSAGQKTRPVHIEHYDDLDRGDVRRLDRFGLNLSADEAERFNELWDQVERVTRAGNRALDGQAELEEVFAELSGTVLGDVSEVADAAFRLREEIRAGALTQLRERMTVAFGAFSGQALQSVEAVGEASLASIETSGEQFIDALLSGGGENTALARLIAALKGLDELRRNLDLSDAPTALQLVEEAIAAIQDLADGELKAMAEATRDLLADWQLQLESVPPAALAEVQQAWSDSGAEGAFEEASELAERVIAIVSSVEQLQRLGEFDNIPPTLRVPEARDVPVDDVRDTRIELQETPRQPGDRLTLRATLLDGNGGVVDTQESALDLDWYGWHAQLHPSVVLARPDENSNGDDGFRFVPMLSWLHTYRPRPGDDGGWDDFMRATQLSGGLHASFLNFDPDNAVEIGLGLSVGMWNGILQTGVGWNLMADSGDEFYYFIGSSLVPLLQTFERGELP